MNVIGKLVLLTTALASIAAYAAQPQSTAFTYQGRLAQSGTPTNGSHDLVFKLYDSPSGGNQIGTTITQNAYPVANGLFTIDLDFGLGTFTGTQLFLNVAVDGNNLAPRQPLNSVPVAQYALRAGSVQDTGVGNSTTLFQGDHLYAGVSIIGTSVPMVMFTSPVLNPPGETTETGYSGATVGGVDVYSLTSGVTQNGSLGGGTLPHEADFRVLAKIDKAYIAFANALMSGTPFSKLQIDVLQSVNSGVVTQSYCYGTVFVTALQPMPQDGVYEMNLASATALYRMPGTDISAGWNFFTNSNAPASCIQ